VPGDRRSGRRREFFSIHWSAEDIQDANNLAFRETLVFVKLREGLMESGLPKDLVLLCISFLMPEARRLERCYLFSLDAFVDDVDNDTVAIHSKMDTKSQETSTGTFTLSAAPLHTTPTTMTQLPQSNTFVYTPEWSLPGVPWWGAR